ncbi:MAG: CPBP family glutamic-type intramembrane protease [Candidatus Neomarinimicrobiota bacterium]
MKFLKSYWTLSKSPFYSLLFALPMLIAYEICIFTMNHSDIVGMRNGADVLFRQFFALFNVYGFYVVGFVVILSFLITYYFQSRGKKAGRFRGQFFLLMFIESLTYGLLMFLFIDRLGGFTMSIGSSSEIRQMIILALGAGVYEEFIFRVIFITAFLFLFKDIFKLHPAISGILSVILSSFIFAAFHYMGAFGDAFNLRSLAIRFAAGVFLSCVYYFRGYGITAYAHTIYDVMVILI